MVTFNFYSSCASYYNKKIKIYLIINYYSETGIYTKNTVGF